MRHIWTISELAYIQEKYPDTSTAIIAKALGRSCSSVYQAAKNIGVKKSAAFMASEASGRLKEPGHKGKMFQFKKGHAPMNKGKKQIEYMSNEAIARTTQTRFGKGHLPHNTKEDNHISIRPDNRGINYKFIRIALSKWIPLHRYNWIQANGAIPKGMKLIFKDGDTMNCDISNLELLTPGDLMKRNSLHNYPKDISQIIQLRGALNRQINKHSKKRKDEK